MRVGSRFHPGMFKVDNFQEFLITYLDDYLDIEVKKGFKLRTHSPISYIVYPKNYKLPIGIKPAPPKEDYSNFINSFSLNNNSGIQNVLNSPDSSIPNQFSSFLNKNEEKINRSFHLSHYDRLYEDEYKNQHLWENKSYYHENPKSSHSTNYYNYKNFPNMDNKIIRNTVGNDYENEMVLQGHDYIEVPFGNSGSGSRSTDKSTDQRQITNPNNLPMGNESTMNPYSQQHSIN